MKIGISILLLITASVCVYSQNLAFYDVAANHGNGLRFWNGNDNYKIHMGNTAEYHYGPVTDYSIKTNMNGTLGRGWTWGVNGSTPIAGLNVSGQMKIAGTFEAGSEITGSSFNTQKTSYTKIQLERHDWSGSHGILFNAYKDITVNGGLGSDANTKYANGPGNYTGGAGAIVFYGNGGSMDFLISPQSTGIDNPISWGGVKMRIMRNGNVGIGTISPSSKLNLVAPGREALRIMDPGSTSKYLSIWQGTGSPVMDAIGSPNFYIGYDQEADVIINRNGFKGVAIGTTSIPSDYKLAVDGKIISEEVKVQVSSSWPDYVFSSDYELMPLEEIEKFIQSNHHLPEVPSAQEIEANGVQLGEMNSLLLKKIEELTLHLIEVNKENTTLRQQLKANSQSQKETMDMVLQLQKEIKRINQN